MFSKNVNNKKCAPKFVFFNEKKSERFGCNNHSLAFHPQLKNHYPVVDLVGALRWA